jgi:hypothetical protein
MLRILLATGTSELREETNVLLVDRTVESDHEQSSRTATEEDINRERWQSNAREHRLSRAVHSAPLLAPLLAFPPCLPSPFPYCFCSGERSTSITISVSGGIFVSTSDFILRRR